jgi:outer membrane protein assembly factor BamB
MQGRTVHQWKQPFHDIWDETAVMRKPVPERQIYFHKARAFPNGDLLAVYDGIGDTPWGYGMVKLDKDSNVIWKNLGHRFHHDFAVAGNGRIFGISHEFRREPLEHNSHLQVPLLEDFVVMLSPNGNTLKQISLLEALRNSRFGRELWRILHFTLWDPLHTNSIEVLDDKTAAALRNNVPVAEPGQVLLAFRELDGGSIALLDVDKEQIVWVLSGSWRSPHDPDILPNGNILMFDNLGDFGPGGESRVVEVNPATGGVIWEYGGDADHPLSSHWRSDQQRLANGNTLITESNGARLVEITPQGDIVWEYINPVRGRDDESVVPVVSWSSRIDPGTTEGQFRALLQRRMAQLEASAPSAGYETATR